MMSIGRVSTSSPRLGAAILFLCLLMNSMCVGTAFVIVCPSKTTVKRATAIEASKHLIEIGDNNFRGLFRGEKYVLVDCCAQWCGPCKLIEPVLVDCAKKWKPSLVVAKYDVESNNDQLKIELLLQGVMPRSLPALILIHKNKMLASHEGIIRPAELEAFLVKHVSIQAEKETVSAPFYTAERRRKSGLISLLAADAGNDYMLRDV